MITLSMIFLYQICFLFSSRKFKIIIFTTKLTIRDINIISQLMIIKTNFNLCNNDI